MFKKRPVILMFAFVVFAAVMLSHTFLISERVQPPAFYANNPPLSLNCASCHACVPSGDSTNFVLEMGLDSSNMTEIISGVTTYTPGTKYFMRMNATKPSSVYGFELTAEDSANSEAGVSSFAVINSVNTALATIGTSNYISHHNADSNNRWTFYWTAPATYTGLVTFYYCGNDGGPTDVQQGCQIYIFTKEIRAQWNVGIADISNKLNSLSVFPTVFDQHIQVSFELKENAKVEGTIVDLNGRVVKTILDEGLSAGNFNRSFDLSGLSAGLYLVKLQIGDAFIVRKIVKD